MSDSERRSVDSEAPRNELSRRRFLEAAGAIAAVAVTPNVAATKTGVLRSVLFRRSLVPTVRELELDTSGPEFQEWLVDQKRLTYDVVPLAPAGMTAEPTRPNEPAPEDIHHFPFIQIETWIVERVTSGRRKEIGRQNAQVCVRHQLKFSLTHRLFLKAGMDEQKRTRARQVFASYRFQTHGEIEAYIAQEATFLSPDEALIDATVAITKAGPKPADVATTQRDAIRALYGVGPAQPVRSRLEIPGSDGVTLATWARLQSIELRLVGTAAPATRDGQPERHENIIEAIPNTEAAATAAIDAIRSRIDETVCGKNMKESRSRVATVSGWPEFMIRWVLTTIRINRCVRIRLNLPRLFTRNAALALFSYYFLPEKPDQFIVERAKHCAMTAAFGAAVIGVALSNFAAAIASFRLLFIECMEDSVSCVDPGLLLVKEEVAPGWRPV